MDVDVLAEYNLTTLGPYSFQVFVAAGFTAKHITSLSVGRRPLEVDGKSHRKRPYAQEVAKTEGPSAKRKRGKGGAKTRSMAEQENIPTG